MWTVQDDAMLRAALRTYRIRATATAAFACLALTSLLLLVAA